MISKVVFVTSPANQNAGSKLLRSDQLRRLAASVLTTRDVPTVTADNTDFSDAILILGKYPLLGANPQTIADSKRRGNLVYADPLDGQVADEVLAAADVLIASSSTQSADFARRFTRQRTAYVGHHVDLRIGPVQSPSDMLRLGYFGEMFNARFAEIAQPHLRCSLDCPIATVQRSLRVARTPKFRRVQTFYQGIRRRALWRGHCCRGER